MNSLTSWLTPQSDATLLFLGSESDLREVAALIRDAEPQPDTLFGFPVYVEADPPTSD